MKPINYVAILGFATQVNERQAYLAKDVARKLTALGYGVGVGNLSGMFDQALKSTKSCGGATMAIIEKDVGQQEHQHCDILLVSPSQDTKHQALSTRCIGGIVIGGGPGTLKLIQHFLGRNKKIIAIDGSGGIVPSELAAEVILSDSVDQALGLLTQ
jgi:predicted Rossmann-fold nucleotide-binding protein